MVSAKHALRNANYANQATIGANYANRITLGHVKYANPNATLPVTFANLVKVAKHAILGVKRVAKSAKDVNPDA